MGFFSTTYKNTTTLNHNTVSLHQKIESLKNEESLKIIFDSQRNSGLIEKGGSAFSFDFFPLDNSLEISYNCSTSIPFNYPKKKAQEFITLLEN